VGNAYFEYKGKIRAAPVIFGKRGIFLLGATTLEALGMIPDPIHRELNPLPLVLMYMQGKTQGAGAAGHSGRRYQPSR